MREITLGRVRRRSHLVSFLRFAFTVGVAVTAGIFVSYLVSHALTDMDTRAAQTVDGVTMLNPRFSGRDGRDRPYLITADTAKQRRGDGVVVDLEAPRLRDSLGTVVRAQEGIYDRALRQLSLTGDVQLEDAGGYRFSSQSAVMFVQDNRIEGDSPLEGGGPLGEVRADAYEVKDGGARIVLTGNVWTRIELNTPEN